jgi:acyl dehydratase
MIDHFAAATKDYQWIHVDQQRAEKESPYKSTIAHGFMSISLIPKFLTEVLDVSSLKMAYNYGLEEVRFPYPVVEGSLLRGIIHVESIEEQKFKSLKVVWKIKVEIKGVRKPACVAKMITIVYE